MRVVVTYFVNYLNRNVIACSNVYKSLHYFAGKIARWKFCLLSRISKGGNGGERSLWIVRVRTCLSILCGADQRSMRYGLSLSLATCPTTREPCIGLLNGNTNLFSPLLTINSHATSWFMRLQRNYIYIYIYTCFEELKKDRKKIVHINRIKFIQPTFWSDKIKQVFSC